TPEPSTTIVKAVTFDPSGNEIPFAGGTYGSFVYLRADVTGNSGAGTPTGVLNFTDGGTSNVAGGPFMLNSRGNTATPRGIFTLAPGSHSIGAHYWGDSSFHSSTSASTVNFTINPDPTTNTIQPSGVSVTVGTPFSLTSVVNTTS